MSPFPLWNPQLGMLRPLLPFQPSPHDTTCQISACSVSGLHYNACSWKYYPRLVLMSSTRPKLQLDEKSFQGLLAAAYTIQEHADLLKQVTKVGHKATQKPDAEAPRVCQHCAAPLQEDESRCGRCGWEELRPGERMQRKFASLWEMSQEQGARQERPTQHSDKTAHPFDSSKSAVLPEAAYQSALTRTPNQDSPQIATESETDPATEVEHTLLSIPLATAEDTWLTEANNRGAHPRSTLFDLRLRLNHHRANLYLGLSVLVAVLALLWPTPIAPQRPRLDLWQRVLVTLGIAEASTPQIHYRGDPNIQVWVDPHTALYYCLGDDQYGKADGGRLTSQRDAQADQFEPANRAACN
jgi:ribosomal protein L40E